MRHVAEEAVEPRRIAEAARYAGEEIDIVNISGEDSTQRVKVEEIAELYYIAPRKNLPLILERGILSHNRAAKLLPEDISMREIQDWRAKKQVPGGLMSHDYANLYFNGRNKMMAKRRPEHDRLCVLRVGPAALNLEGAVIADRNASSDYALFLPSPIGVQRLHREELFVRSWKCPDDQIVSGALALWCALNC